jgi:hypothetical protein
MGDNPNDRDYGYQNDSRESYIGPRHVLHLCQHAILLLVSAETN